MTARRVGQVGQGGARGRVVDVERWKTRRRLKRWQPQGRLVVVVALAAILDVDLGATRGVTAAVVAATAVVVCGVRVAHFL